MLAIYLLLSVGSEIASGAATYYSAGVMEQVIANRMTWNQITPCPECIGAVALADPKQINRRVYLQAPGRPVEGPFLVADCAAAADRAAFEARGRVVDVDHATALRWAMRGPLPGVRIFAATQPFVPARQRNTAPIPE